MKKYLLVLYFLVVITCEDENQKYQRDYGACTGVEEPDKDACNNVALELQDNLCCYHYYAQDDEEDKYCVYIDDSWYDKLNNPKSLAIEKEGSGFYCYNSLSEAQGNCLDNFQEIYECKNKNKTFSKTQYTFTEN